MANGWHDGTTVVCQDYLNAALVPTLRKDTIERTIRHLRPIRDTFDAIAICGVSGMLVGIPVADELHKSLIVVRREKRKHSDFTVEGSIEGRYIIVDDLICTGDTIQYVVDKIREHNSYASCKGIYLWYNMTIEGSFYNDPYSGKIPIIVSAVKTKDVQSNGFFRRWL